MSNDESNRESVIPGSAVSGLDAPTMVKCISCGFAAKRARVAIPPGVNREYFEIPFDERQGHLPVLFNDYTKSAAHTTSIACFRGKVRLEELAELRFEITCPSGLPSDEREGWRSAASNDVLEADRPCGYWYRYEPGRSPQEHLADYMAADLEQRRREFEVRLFELSRKLQTESNQTARYNFWATIIFGVIVVILSIMQVWLASRSTNTIIQMPSTQSEPAQEPSTSR